MRWSYIAWGIVGIIAALIVVGLGTIGPVGTMLDVAANEAEADRIASVAELTDAQAKLEHATGERILREAEGRVIENNTTTANRLITFWGVTFPLMLPWALVLGLVLGGAGVGSFTYYKGFRAGLAEGKATNNSQSPKMPEPELDGG